MRKVWEFGRAVVSNALSKTLWVLSFAGAIGGATAIGIWKDIVKWDGRTIVIAVAVYLLLFVLVGAYGAWSATRAAADGLESSLAEASRPILIGGTGGAGGSTDGSVGDVVIGGNAGGGGGVAFGPGSVASGGEGGKTAGPSPF